VTSFLTGAFVDDILGDGLGVLTFFKDDLVNVSLDEAVADFEDDGAFPGLPCPLKSFATQSNGSKSNLYRADSTSTTQKMLTMTNSLKTHEARSIYP
jgi:hypothetical protein